MQTQPDHSEIDTNIPNIARVRDFFLGGKDNFPADREAGRAYAKLYPGAYDFAHESQRFLRRCVEHLAGLGLDQFLQLGSGLPTTNNTHEVVQRITPAARIVYADSDPLVGSHFDALLTSTSMGQTDFFPVDMRDTSGILAGASRTLHLKRPLALILSDCLGHIADYEEAHALVGRLIERLPSGSYLVISHASDVDPDQRAAHDRYNATPHVVPYILRSPEKIAGFFKFKRLNLLGPGVVPLVEWKPDHITGTVRSGYGGVGHKP